MLIKLAKFIIGVVPEAAANSITRSLAAMTQRRHFIARTGSHGTSEQDELRRKQRRLGLGAALVIFVHGWSGRAAQMAPLALHVAIWASVSGH
jgi:hypothetical protein